MNKKRLIFGIGLLVIVAVVIAAVKLLSSGKLNEQENRNVAQSEQDEQRNENVAQSDQEVILLPTYAILAEVEGEVLVRPAGIAEELVGSDGMRLNTMGEIRTSNSGKVKLEMPDGSWLRMGPNTVLTLFYSLMDAKEEQIQVGLEQGQIWIVLKGGSLAVQTESGLASVRGSMMSVQSDNPEINIQNLISLMKSELARLNTIIHNDIYPVTTMSICNSNDSLHIKSVTFDNSGQALLCSENLKLALQKISQDNAKTLSTLADIMKTNHDMVMLIIRSMGGERTQVECLEGKCDLETEGGEVILGPGEEASVEDLSKEPEIEEMREEDYEEWEENEPETVNVLPTTLTIVEARSLLDANEVDTDGDGVPDPEDDCDVRGDLGWGLDENGCPIISEGDLDEDGILNHRDQCIRVGDKGFGLDEKGCPLPPPDQDGDGYPDHRDHCPTAGDQGYGLHALGCPIPPPNEDTDGDGFINREDRCPLTGDRGFGVDENGCPENPADSDGDGIPDHADYCPDQGEGDLGVNISGCPVDDESYEVNPPYFWNNDTYIRWWGGEDHDNDGTPNYADIDCYFIPSADMHGGLYAEGYVCDETNSSFDGVPHDDDDDGIFNKDDVCPFVGDQGLGIYENGCPARDSDKDGLPDQADSCPYRGDEGLGLKPDGCPAVDTDGDGLLDKDDACPELGNQGLGLKPNGCPAEDSDGDGILDKDDACPEQGNQGLGLKPNGCPAVDSDGDGIIDKNDACPNEGDHGLGLKPDGCPAKDSDGDGIIDKNDACPNQGDQGLGLKPDGCPAKDSDGDGIIDKNDACPNQGDQGLGLKPNGCPAKDSDGDGIIDKDDACPNKGDQGWGLHPNGCPVKPTPTP